MKKQISSAWYLWCLAINFLTGTTSAACETESTYNFIYPVAQLDQDHLLLMHQALSDCTELFVWNKNTHALQPELNALYLPAHVQLLPSKRAYSFLDRGRIRVKSFSKRTPKTININEPLSGIQMLTWINDEQCYFAAKIRSAYKIFLYDIAVDGGTLYSLSNMDNDTHYTFPCKVGDLLYCITQTQDDFFHITCCPWDPKPYTQNATLPTIEASPEYRTITNFFPLCFLQIVSEQKGFVLEIQADETSEKCFHFILYQLEFCSSTWIKMTKLFTFQLPKNLITGYGHARLYESIYPLLPRYFKHHEEQEIYFTDFDEQSGQCTLMKHDKNGIKKLSCVTKNSLKGPCNHLFAPFLTAQNELISGYGIESHMCRGSSPIDNNLGISYCHLPYAA